MSVNAQQSRVDALIRIVGLLMLVFGAVTIYYTYANASDPGFAPELAVVYYFLGLVLVIVGLLGAFAKFK